MASVKPLLNIGLSPDCAVESFWSSFFAEKRELTGFKKRMHQTMMISFVQAVLSFWVMQNRNHKKGGT